MMSIDLRNALLDPRADNFRCQLFRLLMKADHVNMQKMEQVYPLEVNMVRIYRSHSARFPDFDEIETKAKQYVEAKAKV